MPPAALLRTETPGWPGRRGGKGLLVFEKDPALDFGIEVGVASEFEEGVAVEGHNLRRFLLDGEGYGGGDWWGERKGDEALVGLRVGVLWCVEDCGGDLEDVSPGPAFDEGP